MGEDGLNRVEGKKSGAKATPKKKREIGPGGLMKAVLRPGEGSKHPKEGDQVIFHYITRTTEGVVVESSRADHGGRGAPLRMVLGKSKMIAGWEEGLPTMLKGETAMLKIRPDLHYADPECPVTVAENFPKGEDLFFETELLDFQKVKVLKDDLGVTKLVLRDGEGWETPRAPYEVNIWITARVLGGPTFFSQKEGDPLHLTFGKEELPEELEKAIGTMTRNEKALIYISRPYCSPASYSLNLNVPPEAEELEFEVELIQLIQVRDMFGDGGLIKRRIRDGTGEFPIDCPLQDSVMCIHYKGMLLEGGKIFYNTRTDNPGGEPLEFASGEGAVPEGLEASLRLMLPGELALINSVSKYAYDKFPRPEGVPEGASVQWEVELLGYEKAKEWEGLNFKEIMAEVDAIKAAGNRLFKEGKFELAKTKYDKVLRDFKHVNPHGDEEAQELQTTNNTFLLNVAACYHKLGEYVKSIETCNKVLEGNPHHVKALYRRGMAFTETGDFDEARSDFKLMMTVDKSATGDANAALAKLKKREQEAELKARKQFKGLFDKRPGELSEETIVETPGHESTETSITQDSKAETLEKSETVEDATAPPQATTPISRLFKVGHRFLRQHIPGKCAIL
ncbi:unnamed protein product [Sphagnum compactum]